mgnify:CR=1 FL=1
MSKQEKIMCDETEIIVVDDNSNKDCDIFERIIN